MIRSVLLCALLPLGACVAARPVAPPVQRAEALPTLTFEGACDASGAVVIDRWHFVVGDDEDNVLRVYDLRTGGPPVRSVDLSAHLELPVKKRPPEVDIEAATDLGEYALWIASHGRTGSGKKSDSRLRFFVTRRTNDDRALELVGRVYRDLIGDLLAAPELAHLDLAAAETLAPREPGGINVEGLSATGDGESVLIGFRNPVPQGRALVVPLLNPLALVEGGPARFGPPRLLDLGGLGIRSLSRWRGRYLLIGGPIDVGATSRLFSWSGGDEEPTELALDLTGFNPEAFVSNEEEDRVLLLSDDGERPIDGTPCKRLKDATQKRFRGVWVDPTR